MSTLVGRHVHAVIHCVQCPNDFSLNVRYNNGFYVTADLEQAVKFANKQYEASCTLGITAYWPVIFIFCVEDAVADQLRQIKYPPDARSLIDTVDGVPRCAADLIELCRNGHVPRTAATERNIHWIEGPMRRQRGGGGVFSGHQVCVKIASGEHNPNAACALFNRSFAGFTLHRP